MAIGRKATGFGWELYPNPTRKERKIGPKIPKIEKLKGRGQETFEIAFYIYSTGTPEDICLSQS
jgi:hypothetical protein